MNKTQKRQSLWRNTNYLLLWGGQIVSDTGSQMSQLAFPLLILALTSSPVQAAAAGALRALPYLVFSLPAGVLVDRWNRKQVMIFCDAGRAASLASIFIALILGRLGILQIYIVSLIEGTLYVFFNVAEVACLPNLVSREQLPKATAQNQMANAVTTLVGPFLSGLLYSLQQMLPFLADAVSYTFSVISLSFIKMEFQRKQNDLGGKWRIEVTEGLKWLWGHPLIRSLAIFAGVSNLLSAGYTLLIVVLAERLHTSSVIIGFIFTVGGLGGVLGAILTPLVQKLWNFGQALPRIWWLLAGFTALYVVAPNPWTLGAISFFLFLLWPMYNTIQFTYRLTLIPSALQGRVNSVFRLIAFSGQPLGLALTGWLVDRIGVIPTVLFTATGLAIMALAGTLNPYVRHACPLAEIIQKELDGSPPAQEVA